MWRQKQVIDIADQSYLSHSISQNKLYTYYSPKPSDNCIALLFSELIADNTLFVGVICSGDGSSGSLSKGYVSAAVASKRLGCTCLRLSRDISVFSARPAICKTCSNDVASSGPLSS